MAGLMTPACLPRSCASSIPLPPKHKHLAHLDGGPAVPGRWQPTDDPRLLGPALGLLQMLHSHRVPDASLRAWRGGGSMVCGTTVGTQAHDCWAGREPGRAASLSPIHGRQGLAMAFVQEHPLLSSTRRHRSRLGAAPARHYARRPAPVGRIEEPSGRWPGSTSSAPASAAAAPAPAAGRPSCPGAAAPQPRQVARWLDPSPERVGGAGAAGPPRRDHAPRPHLPHRPPPSP